MLRRIINNHTCLLKGTYLAFEELCDESVLVKYKYIPENIFHHGDWISPLNLSVYFLRRSSRLLSFSKAIDKSSLIVNSNLNIQ